MTTATSSRPGGTRTAVLVPAPTPAPARARAVRSMSSFSSAYVSVSA